MKNYIFYIIIITSIVTTIPSKANIPYHSKWQEGKIVHPTIAMSADELDDLLAKLRQKANDTEKLAFFKESLREKGITTDQVIILLNQFNEDPKLEAAIYAFQYTVDYKKYLKVQDSFGNDINKRKLQDYVDKHRK